MVKYNAKLEDAREKFEGIDIYDTRFKPLVHTILVEVRGGGAANDETTDVASGRQIPFHQQLG